MNKNIVSDDNGFNNIFDNIKNLVINSRNRVYVLLTQRCLIYSGILVR